MAHTVEIRERFVAVTFSGVVDRDSVAAGGGLSADGLKAARRLGRLLFDFTDVTQFGYDPLALGDAMRRLAGQGLRLAVCAGTPAMFGIGRQIAQWSQVEGTSIRVFRDRVAAEAWLAFPEGEGEGEGDHRPSGR